MPDPTNTTWTYHHGVHNGTIWSRDRAQPRSLPSLEDCRREALADAQFYASMGRQIWFSDAVGPDGQRVTLIPGRPYAR